MSIINYAAPRQLLVTAGGHPYERDAFATLFDSLEGFSWSLVEQPAAQYLFDAGLGDRFAACVCYDMPGVNFLAEDPPALVEPAPAFKQGFLELLEAGMGFVFLHHSIAAWPAWEEYAEIVGGRFHYRPANLRGQAWPDSGYRHQVDHRVEVVARHPVTEGIPTAFNITDELYLCPVFEGDLVPLLRSDYAFTDDNFYSAKRAVEGIMYSREGWNHPPGSNLVGWVKHYRNSPIVYLQGGDDPVAYASEEYQRLLHNAIHWVASEEAHLWARQRYREEASP